MPNATLRMPIIVASSILSADFGRLAEKVRVVDAAGVDWIHIDVTNGRFVPNITIRYTFIEISGGQNCESAGEAIGADANAIVAGPRSSSRLIMPR